ncbi:MAG: c-type cytochrome, partial [Thiohalocapsa sp.]
EPNKIGPNLFGVMEENIAAVPGYQFSQALAAHKSEKWDPDKLNEWLFKPQEFAKGTKMSFPGLPKEQDRADVIAYLETLGPNGEEMLKQAKEKAAAAAKQEEKKPAGAATPAPGKTGEKAPAAPEKSGGAAPAQQAPAGVPANPPAGPNATK